MTEQNKLGPYTLDTIYTGDAKELARAIPDESVDLIFTDPPYPKEFLLLYEWLAQEASRILKYGGLLITLAGHIYIDSVIGYLGKHLDYHWIGGISQTMGFVGRVHPRQMMCSWKPALWYSKGHVEHAYVFDLFSSIGADKRYHDWGQPENWFTYYVNKLTDENSIVFDPFTGGGTVPAVCKMLGRHYLAFEIDPKVAEDARQRVQNTQPPLLIPEPEQVEMFAEVVA